MDAQLEKLIDLALADGQLTDKERQVLTRKALELGVDQDEFEMVLDAKLHLVQKAAGSPNAQISHPSQSQSQKEGEVKKCPSCGSTAQSFATKCPDCGHEFRNITSDVSINSIFNMLQQIESEERNRPKPKLGLSMLLDQSSMFGIELAIANRQATVISNFPVPNSKEAILEFLSLAVPQTKTKLQKFMFSTAPIDKPKEVLKNAWKGKCDQIIMKARFSMKEDPATLAEIERYAREL